MAKEKRGGARPGAGRKEVKDKKKAIFLWLKSSIIINHGGVTILKAKLEADLN